MSNTFSEPYIDAIQNLQRLFVESRETMLTLLCAEGWDIKALRCNGDQFTNNLTIEHTLTGKLLAKCFVRVSVKPAMDMQITVRWERVP